MVEISVNAWTKRQSNPPPLAGEGICCGFIHAVLNSVRGAKQDGRREILGLGLGESEGRVFWVESVRGPQQCSLSGIQLVISDAREELNAAIARVFPASWQRCWVHFMRNLPATVPKTHQTMLGTLVRQVFVQPLPPAPRRRGGGGR